MNNKVIVAALIGFFAAFILGFLVFGMALGPMMNEHMMTGMSRPQEEFQWAFLLLGNLFSGLLYAWVLNKANANSFGSGATTGAILGLLMTLAFDFTMYGVSHMFTDLTGLFLDVIGSIVVGLLLGGVIGWWYGRGRKAVIA